MMASASSYPTWGVGIVTASGLTALTIAEVRSWLRVDDTVSDSDITALLTAAAAMVERDTGQVLLSSTFKLVLDEWPADQVIRLPRAPVTSIASVRYVDSTGAWQTLDSATYVLANIRNPARLGLAANKTWPDVASQIGAIEVSFVAGYASAAAVPKNLTMALRLLASHWNENREAVVVGSINQQLELGYRNLIAGDRMEWIA